VAKPAVETRTPALAALSAGADRLATEGSVAEALRAVAEAARVASSADLAILRIVEDGLLATRGVAGPPFLIAEIVGSRMAAPPEAEIDELEQLPEQLQAIVARTSATAVFVVPVPHDGTAAGSLELYRSGESFDEAERAAARLTAAQAALALRVFQAERVSSEVPAAIGLAAEALGAGADEARTAERIARLAADATGAAGCVLWRAGEEELDLACATGAVDPEGSRNAATAALRGHGQAVEEVGDLVAVSLPLGQPAFGVLQLLYRERPAEADLALLGAFAGRAAQALRTSERAGEVRRELERTRDLLSVVGQATAQLSLSHTLETAIARVPELLEVQAAAVYLRAGGRLETASSRGVAGPHAVVAARLLDLALGPFRARGIVASDDAAHDRRLASVRAAATEAGIEAAHAVPLVAHGDVIGLFAVYPPLGRELTSDQSALLGALAGQIAVAVQNARLHEETKLLGMERERALDAERVAARRLSALYEISRSFAQSLSLDSTLDAVARTLVELLVVDAAVIRLPDERGESLVAQAVHVSSPQLQQAVQAIFDQPDPIVASGARRRLAEGRPVRLDPGSAEELGRSHRLLVPFLERGSTAAVIPIATPSELLATLTLVSLDPRRPLTDETIDTALTVAAQAALAVDNARLYQQQKAFTDSMQRSLLPRTRPRMAGLEIGAIYESSALVGVGGDIYDYLQTGDDRLAIVLGDVTGHGIDAAADMAMAKFVFRSLARLYPEPGAFLGAANDVVVEEIGAGKFITMLYLTIDLGRGEVACASAGHPQPRLLDAGGAVSSLDAKGLVLGIAPGIEYSELRRPFEPGASVVLYTDGLVEARRAGEMYGEERLDRVLAANHELPPEQLAAIALEECRRWVAGDLRDDCAIVVVRRT
jgi:serine phosphatase RsbU (regulator of sigma subunit)